MTSRVWRWPGGYSVTIRVVSERVIKRVNGKPAHGCWNGERRVIYVDKALGEQEQRYVLTHEAIHALADWQHFFLGGETSPTTAASAVRR